MYCVRTSSVSSAAFLLYFRLRLRKTCISSQLESVQSTVKCLSDSSQPIERLSSQQWVCQNQLVSLSLSISIIPTLDQARTKLYGRKRDSFIWASGSNFYMKTLHTHRPPAGYIILAESQIYLYSKPINSKQVL
jgi:hypothetical protein